MGDGDELFDAIRELGVGDHETADTTIVEELEIRVDLGVDDGLSNKRQSTVTHLESFLKPLRNDTRNSTARLFCHHKISNIVL